MPPRKRRQRAGAMNYRKRKDVTVARGDGGSGAVEGRVEGSEAHGKLETEERGFEERSEEVRDDGGSGTVEERVEESEEAECGPSSSSLRSSEEAPAATKRRRLSEITAMGDEPLQAWLDSLPREDFQHMALLLYKRLPTIFGLKKTDTATAVGEILQKNERTIRRWVDDFASNSGEFSDSQQGHYTRNNTLMSNEEISERARVYVRGNAAPKGRPNLTATAFCQWVNNELLPNSTLEPGYPRRVSVETARKWLHDLGFDVLHMSKGVFIDGHERPDVVESREKFLRTMTECGFLRPDNAPTQEAARALAADVPHVSKKEGEKRIVWFHDESAYNTTEDTQMLWGEKGKLPIKPKGKGSSIMVSEFIEEKDGYLALSDEQYEFEVTNSGGGIKKSALALLEIGENREGYWTGQRFVEQVTKAVKIAEVKYPTSQGYHHIWCFDHSCNHTAFAEDALIASKMNKGPGGKQPKMRDTVWNGQPQTMNLPDGRPKGAALVLEERGYNTRGMKLEEMRAILADHDDFKNEKCRVDRFLSNICHTCVFIPKFHCELNPIERVWAQSKRYTRAYCDYTIGSLRRSIPLGLKSVSKENIANYVHRCRNYMFAYLEGSAVGQELEEKIKFYKSASYTSHRRVGIND
jgi:hypothetical protein